MQLRAAIVRREIAPGAPGIIEQLAEALGVSRTPIREALPALHQLGLIVESASSSCRVVRLDASCAREVYAVRSALECLLPFLNVLIDSVRVHRARLLEFEPLEDASHRNRSHEERLAIVEALEQRNGPAARRLLRAHLDRVGASLAKLVSR